MEHAWIAGQPATLDAAIEGAAKLLASSRCATHRRTGNGYCRCARRDNAGGSDRRDRRSHAFGRCVARFGCHALVRHVHNDTHRSARARRHAPLDRPRLWRSLAGTAVRNCLPRRSKVRSAVRLSVGFIAYAPRAIGPVPASAVVVKGQRGEIPTLLAALRARLADRPIGKMRVPSSNLDQVATALKAARFGVAIWSAAAIDAPTIEMLCGLLNDLNAATRFSGLPLPAADNAIGVTQTCAWMTGLPVRTGFARAFPEHDPWIFDGHRVVSEGEADCLLWISAYRGVAPPWRTAPPTIALTARDANFEKPPRVHIAVGCPGIDHAGVEYLSSTGTLAPVEAKKPSGAISVSEVIARIIAALPATRELAC